MYIHREGYLILVIAFILLLALDLLFFYYIPRPLWLKWIVLAGSLMVFGLILQFFRVPKLVIDPVAKKILSPADGTVVNITEEYEDEYFKEKKLKVSIFMSIYDVHMNRIPLSGTLVHYTYHPGKYLVAWHPKSSKLNERNTIVIRDEHGTEILLRQIAGAVARRIRFYHEQGEAVTQGEPLGFIRFGSRVDIFMPLGTQILVEEKQHIQAGIDYVAQLP